MEWLEKLQVPGLILAGAVVWLQFRIIMELLKDRRLRDEKALLELAENTKVTARVAAILDLICKRTKQ